MPELRELFHFSKYVNACTVKIFSNKIGRRENESYALPHTKNNHLASVRITYFRWVENNGRTNKIRVPPIKSTVCSETLDKNGCHGGTWQSPKKQKCNAQNRGIRFESCTHHREGKAERMTFTKDHLGSEYIWHWNSRERAECTFKRSSYLFKC